MSKEYGYIMLKDRKMAKILIDTYGFELLESYADVFPVRSDAELHKWWTARQTPYNRDYITDVFKYLNIRDTIDYIRLTKFASVNDAWWIKTSSKQTWGSINLFHNSFNKFISDICIDGFKGQRPINYDVYSPEFTLGGSFPKTWKHINNDIVLLKASRNREGELKNSSIYSEVLSNQLCEYLGITNYVRYSLTTYKNVDVCSCKCFTNENLMYYPAVYNFSGYPSYEEVKKVFGDYELFYQMLLLDYLILNIDRHTGNYGFLIDSETLNRRGMCPIYDNNYGLLPDIKLSNKSRKDIDDYRHTCSSRFNDLSIYNLGRILLKDYPKTLIYCKKLLNFNFSPIDSIDDLRLKRLSSIVRMQAKDLLKLC